LERSLHNDTHGAGGVVDENNQLLAKSTGIRWTHQQAIDDGAVCTDCGDAITCELVEMDDGDRDFVHDCIQLCDSSCKADEPWRHAIAHGTDVVAFAAISMRIQYIRAMFDVGCLVGGWTAPAKPDTGIWDCGHAFPTVGACAAIARLCATAGVHIPARVDEPQQPVRFGNNSALDAFMYIVSSSLGLDLLYAKLYQTLYPGDGTHDPTQTALPGMAAVRTFVFSQMAELDHTHAHWNIDKPLCTLREQCTTADISNRHTSWHSVSGFRDCFEGCVQILAAGCPLWLYMIHQSAFIAGPDLSSLHPVCIIRHMLLGTRKLAGAPVDVSTAHATVSGTGSIDWGAEWEAQLLCAHDSLLRKSAKFAVFHSECYFSSLVRQMLDGRVKHGRPT
jgi:hypothetical protein